MLVEDNSLLGAAVVPEVTLFKAELTKEGVFRLGFIVEPTRGDNTLEWRDETTESVSESPLEYFLFSERLFTEYVLLLIDLSSLSNAFEFKDDVSLV